MATERKAEPRKPGRPSKYKDDFPAQAKRLAKLGLTDEEMASFFEVSLATLSNWKNEHPEFLEALKGGKSPADGKVAESLYRRATGYKHKAVKLFFDSKTGQVVEHEYTEHYPPDPTSMIFWLKNRRPDLWRDRPNETEADKEQPPVQVVFNVADASRRDDE